MERDLRDTPLYKEVAAYFTAIYEPGANWVSKGGTVTVSPDGRRAAFTGTVFHDLQSAPVTRVCLVDLASGEMQQVAAAQNSDRLPRWSPDGRKLAFLSDREGAGNFQLYLLNPDGSGAAHAAPVLNGTVEYFHWSPTGRSILLGLAGFGADLAGIEGGGRTVGKQDELPAWLPEIETADAENLWRSLWVVDTETDEQRRLTREGLNPWEANWCGDAQVVAVASESHSEGSWYVAKLYLLDVKSTKEEVIYTPADQLGWPVGSPSGARLAFAEAVCSDRWLVCGDLFLLDLQTGRKQAIDTNQAGVVHLIWRDEEHLVYVGLREFEIIVGEVDCAQGKTIEWWSSAERTLGSLEWGYPTAWPLPHGGVVAFAEAYQLAPELVTITANGEYRVVKSLATQASRAEDFKGAMEPVRWRARDGLELQGWVVRPAGAGPFPLVMDIHGGPVWTYRNSWHGRLRGAKAFRQNNLSVYDLGLMV